MEKKAKISLYKISRLVIMLDKLKLPKTVEIELLITYYQKLIKAKITGNYNTDIDLNNKPNLSSYLIEKKMIDTNSKNSNNTFFTGVQEEFYKQRKYIKLKRKKS